MNTSKIGRRSALLSVGLGIAAGASAFISTAEAAETVTLPAGAKTFADLSARLAKAPRRRAFKTVPMILTSPDTWDHEALGEVLAYSGGPKQLFDNVDIAGPWLNLMRNSANAQVFAFKHPDFLCVSATHSTAHLALIDQAMWDKYQLAKLAKLDRNTFILEQKAAEADPKDFENPEGSSPDTTIPFRRCRGAASSSSDATIPSGR